MPVGPRRPCRRRRDRSRDHANTAVIVGSAPCFPNGVVDPIEELASWRAGARHRLPHRRAASAASCCRGPSGSATPVPPFDFRVPGVTSMSADTHKYGYAAKGTSVVLYRDKDLRHYQYYTTAKWAGGLYFVADVRRFATGRAERGVLGRDAVARRGGLPRRDAAGSSTPRDAVKEGIAKIDGVDVIGDPLCGTSPFTAEETRHLPRARRHGSLTDGA